MSCKKVKKIKEVNDKYDYVDEYPNGEGDSKYVACGQSTYNELDYIYENKLKKKGITEEKAAKAFCECCEELNNPRKRDAYYDCLEKKLKIKID